MKQRKSIKIRFNSLKIVRTMAIKSTLLFCAVFFKLVLLYQAAYTVSNRLCILPSDEKPPRLEEKLLQINRMLAEKLYPQHVREQLCRTIVGKRQKKKRQNNNSSNSNSNSNCNNNCVVRNDVERLADDLEADHEHFVTVYPRQQNPRNPVISYTTIEAPPDYNSHPNLVMLTVAMSAEIHYSNLQPAGRDTISSDVETHLANLDWYRGGGPLENDERGHLLADSLGGSGDRFNFVPQSPLINRNAFIRGNVVGEFCWYDVEENIRNFLITGGDGVYVRWTLVVGYGHLPISRRPTHFMLSVRRFNPNHRLIDTAQYIIPNIPSYACRNLNDPWWKDLQF